MNLSNSSLTTAHLSLLELGLSFIPTPLYTSIKALKLQTHKLNRKILLKQFFRDEETNTTPTPSSTTYAHRDEEYVVPVQYSRLFTEPSTWMPPLGSIPDSTKQTTSKISSATERIIQGNPKIDRKEGPCLVLGEKPNLSRKQTTALNDLKRNPLIIIKPADKGGATVIMDTTKYIHEANRQLSDRNYYRQIDKPVSPNCIAEITHILHKMHSDGHISRKQLDHLTGPNNYRLRIFYMLPKIHKPTPSWPDPHMPKGRPIISDINSESYRLSRLIDHYIAPLSSLHPAYVKNSHSFILDIKGTPIRPTDILVTADVASLYTNMRIPRILDVVRRAFRNNPHATRPDEAILRLLDLTLNHNDFTFNNQTYIQTCGCAMGKIYSPSLANLYMAEFDELATSNPELPIQPKVYKRYLDDIFMVWPGTVEQLAAYNRYLNNIIPGIEIEMKYSHSHIDFLDTTIHKVHHRTTTRLTTNIFFKETDTHQLLHTTSYHPPHTTPGILKSQLLRFKRICMDQTLYEMTCDFLFSRLLHRGYKQKEMNKLKKQIWEEDQSLRTKPQGRIFPIIYENNRISRELATEIKEIITLSIQTDTTFTETDRVLPIFTNPPNLRKMLVRALLPKPSLDTPPPSPLPHPAPPNESNPVSTNPP